MNPRIAITRTWSDNDVAKLAFEVCDGTSVFANEACVELDWGVASAAALRVFSQQIHGGLFDLVAGEEGLGQHFQFKGSQAASHARLFLRTEHPNEA